MDLLGDIVEHDIDSNEIVAPMTSEFRPQAALKPSRWKQRLQNKGIASMSGVVDNGAKEQRFYKKSSEGLNEFRDAKDRKLNYKGLSEKEQIHQENIEILSRMSVDEREEAKNELLDSLDPKILQMLMNRTMNKSKAETADQVAEGAPGTWVGGDPEEEVAKKEKDKKDVDEKEGKEKEAVKPKKIRFEKEAKVIYVDRALKVKDLPNPEEDEWEDVTDVIEEGEEEELGDAGDQEPNYEEVKILNDTANSNLVKESAIHFPKPSTPYEQLDINDPQFNEKLHEKYFPDLPQNANQLEWMKSSPRPTPQNIEYESLTDVRFDFDGNIVNSQNIQALSNSNSGLFNHSQNPELPGYTLTELAHLLRSTFPGQCCIASRTLGRIMYKLGTLQYQIQECADEEDDNDIINSKGHEGQFEIECWKLIDKLQIIDLLQHYSSDNQKNISIKNYAIDALWLWNQCHGDEKIKKFSKETDIKSNQ